MTVEKQCKEIVERLALVMERMKKPYSYLLSKSAMHDLTWMNKNEVHEVARILSQSPCWGTREEYVWSDVSYEDYVDHIVDVHLVTYSLAFGYDMIRLETVTNFALEESSLAYEFKELAIKLDGEIYDTMLTHNASVTINQNGMTLTVEPKNKYNSYLFQMATKHGELFVSEGKKYFVIDFKDIIWVKERKVNPFTQEEEFMYPGKIWREIGKRLKELEKLKAEESNNGE